MICSLCDARCCKERIISITIFDVIRIMEKTKKEFDEIAELRRANLLNVDYSNLLTCKDDVVEMEYLLALKSHPCIFLKNNRCSIYEFSPLVCRAYPFSENKKIGELVACPLKNKIMFSIRGIDKEIIENLKKEDKEYKKIIKKWNERKEGGRTKKDCVRFLFKEAGSEQLFKNFP